MYRKFSWMTWWMCAVEAEKPVFFQVYNNEHGVQRMRTGRYAFVFNRFILVLDSERAVFVECLVDNKREREGEERTVKGFLEVEG